MIRNAARSHFCANDVIAIRALDAAQKIGLQVLEDVSVIGVDDIPMASLSMISLTTTRLPIGEIGSMAAKLISEAVRDGGDGKTMHHNLPTSLVMRATTGWQRRFRGACADFLARDTSYLALILARQLLAFVRVIESNMPGFSNAPRSKL